MKKTINENYRVVVIPDGDPTEDFYRTCKRIEKEIRRHVDDVCDVTATYDTREVCEFCGYNWEWKDNEEPCCCDKALEEWHAANKNAEKDK